MDQIVSSTTYEVSPRQWIAIDQKEEEKYKGEEK